MNNAEKVINAIKNGYIWVIDQIEAHPHYVLWAVLAYMVVRR